MTYNTHSCIGLDGKSKPWRVARIIKAFEPDIVALQELDVNRRRTAGQDQVALIAAALDMRYQFMPLVSGQQGTYGIAVLSKHPFRLIKAGHLTPVSSKRKEARGAVWIEIDVNGRRLHAVNTHLGLTRAERIEQVRVLLGSQWLGALQGDPPLILCGDFNAGPRSATYQMIHNLFTDVQLAAPSHRPKSTFISMWPFTRIDHIFVSSHFTVHLVQVPTTPMVRITSDHLPLITCLGFPKEDEFNAKPDRQ